MNDVLEFATKANNTRTEKFDQQLPATFGKRKEVDFPSTSELFNEVFENSFHAMYIGNGNGRILKFNEKICKMFGYSECEIMELESFRIFEFEGEELIDFLNERNAKGIAKRELTCVNKSGEKFPCLLSSVAYNADNGQKRSMNTLLDLSKN